MAIRAMRTWAMHACLALAAGGGPALGAQPDYEAAPDDGDVVEGVRDYVEGVLDANPTRVQRAAHPLLAKRRVADAYWGSPSREWLRPITHEQLPGLIDYLHESGMVSPADPEAEVEVLTRTGSMAAVRASSGMGTQLLHLARMDGRWLVVDDAYEMGSDEPGAERDVRAAVSDYARGIYSRDPARTLGACHTSLARRELVEGADGDDMLRPMTYEELGLHARTYNAYWEFNFRTARKDIEVLAVGRSVASARLDGETWTDLVHLARLNGDWLIIDVLTETREPAERP